MRSGPDVLGPLASLREHPDTLVFSGLGSVRSMQWRRGILENIALDRCVGLACNCLIYPTAHRSRTAVLFPGSILSHNARLGHHTLLYHNAIVAHDSVIGDGSIVSNGAVVSGNVSIGQSCYIGANATVLEGRSIGDRCVIAAGATVVVDVAPGTIYISRGQCKPNHYWSIP